MGNMPIPLACPLCCAPSDLDPEFRRKLIAWRCSFCKSLFRLIVYEPPIKERNKKTRLRLDFVHEKELIKK
jgi:hypothetical protein